jgi:aryl-alcohol dehydrogenase-like predicted oxidoreductase
MSSKVVYQAGVNEKLLGDFIRKHNVRDKVFSKSLLLPVRSA